MHIQYFKALLVAIKYSNLLIRNIFCYQQILFSLLNNFYIKDSLTNFFETLQDALWYHGAFS